MSPDVGRLTRIAAGLSIFAALVHGIVTPEHVDEWWGYGVFFMMAGLAQGLYGVALLMDWWRTAGAEFLGSEPVLAARRFYLAGILGNGAIILLYLVTRTVGIPFFGPAAGEVEEFSALSLFSKALEVALIVVLLRLWARAPDVARAASAAPA